MQRHQVKNIRAFNRELYTIAQRKVSLNAYDDKKIILSDHSALSHGHYKIVQLREEAAEQEEMDQQ